MEKKAVGKGISLHRDPVGELGGGFIFQTSEDTVIFGFLFLDLEDVRSLKRPGLP